jgi:hypothetical protein
MTLLTEPTRIVLSRTQIIPAVIGEPWGGGYFAGYISHTADGNPTHALIVAPRATGATGTGYTLTTNLAWKTLNNTTSDTASDFDGAANTAAMVTAGINIHPAANFCVGLSIGGFSDWYLPAATSWTLLTSTLSQAPQLTTQARAATFIQCHSGTLTIRLPTRHKLRSLLLTPAPRRLLLVSTGRPRSPLAPQGGACPSPVASRSTAPRRTPSPSAPSAASRYDYDSLIYWH